MNVRRAPYSGRELGTCICGLPHGHTHDSSALPTVRLRYLSVDGDSAVSSLLLSVEHSRDIAVRLLDKLGIALGDGEKPIQAWLRAMAEENGLPTSIPVDRRLGRAIAEDVDASRFLFV